MPGQRHVLPGATDQVGQASVVNARLIIDGEIVA